MNDITTLKGMGKKSTSPSKFEKQYLDWMLLKLKSKTAVYEYYTLIGKSVLLTGYRLVILSLYTRIEQTGKYTADERQVSHCWRKKL